METIDDLDREVLVRLGYAIARSQLFELALLKLLEVQRHDLATPLDERLPEIERWLTTMTAGRAAKELRLPQDVAADLQSVAERRNGVAHRGWNLYLTHREKHGDAAGDVYRSWLEDEAAVLGRAYNGLTEIVREERNSPEALTPDRVRALWRHSVPQRVESGVLPTF